MIVVTCDLCAQQGVIERLGLDLLTPTIFGETVAKDGRVLRLEICRPCLDELVKELDDRVKNCDR